MKYRIRSVASSSVSSQDSNLEQSSLASFPSCPSHSWSSAEGFLQQFQSSMLGVLSLFGGPAPPEFPSTESAIYLETCLVWPLLFISPGQFNLMLHLFWLTASTILKSSPLNEEHLMGSIPRHMHKRVRKKYLF